MYLPIGYSVDVNGVVKNDLTNKPLKQNMSNSGYLCVYIKSKGYFVHRAIAFAYIERIEDKNYVNHKDGVKTNNSLDNLEWVTFSENVKHAYANGLNTNKPLHYKGKFGKDHNRSKSVICVETGKVYGSQCEAGRELGISNTSVSWSIKHRKPIYGMHFEIGS